MKNPLVLTSSDQAVLTSVKKAVFERADEGTFCPCCDQHVKVYRRKINSQMARSLIAAYREQAHSRRLGEWFSMPELLKKHGISRADEAKLVHWGLLEAFLATRDDGSARNGTYRITPSGLDFVRGKLTTWKYVYIYNQRVLGFSDGLEGRPTEKTHISDALGDQFNYRELMEQPIP